MDGRCSRREGRGRKEEIRNPPVGGQVLNSFKIRNSPEANKFKTEIATSAVRLIRDDGWGLQGGESRFVDTLQHSIGSAEARKLGVGHGVSW
jgi:hypothetical protein